MAIVAPRLKISDLAEKRRVDFAKKGNRTALVTLSLTSLVDVFAILVIYLLINQSTIASWISEGFDIELPKAKVAEVPPKSLTVQISKSTVFVEGQAIDRVADVLKMRSKTIPSLMEWLKLVTQKNAMINVLADGSLHYNIIRKLVHTCHTANFPKVNLVVQPASNLD
jgi:biopolymer transport protein ExbD